MVRPCRAARLQAASPFRQRVRYMADATPSSTSSDPTASSLDNLFPQPASTLAPKVSPSTFRSDSMLSFPSNIRTALTIRSLMAANMHLGHAPGSWDRRMLPFIYGERNGIHIINLEHTLTHLRRAVNVTREVAFANGRIVFVGTKRSIHSITVDAATRAGEGAYFVLDWIDGTILNRERILSKSSGYNPEKVVQPDAPVFAQGGAGRRRRSSQADEEEEGEKKPTTNRQPYVHVPDLLILLDYPNTVVAAREANRANIPIIALCDTDCDPTYIQYPIPGNDDALTSVEIVAGVLSLAAREGRTMRAMAAERTQGQPEERPERPKY
ncbi:hypothetical protein HDV00_001327 [Rhizophlyctis rosea]|nr:hypothetical protein HDV00_001327 [Rhizophlyctis rosea]